MLKTGFLPLVPLVFGLFVWDKLPRQLGTHLRYTGEVNGTSDKLWFVVGLPLVLLVCYFIMAIVIDLFVRSHLPLAQKFKLASAGLMGFVPSLLIAYNIGWFSDIRKLVMVGIALTWLVIGNYGNKDIAFFWPKQTAYSRKIRRLTSYLFVGFALLLLVSLVFPIQISFWLMWIETACMILWSLFSSFYMMKKQNSEA